MARVRFGNWQKQICSCWETLPEIWLHYTPPQRDSDAKLHNRHCYAPCVRNRPISGGWAATAFMKSQSSPSISRQEIDFWDSWRSATKLTTVSRMSSVRLLRAKWPSDTVMPSCAARCRRLKKPSFYSCRQVLPATKYTKFNLARSASLLLRSL